MFEATIPTMSSLSVMRGVVFVPGATRSSHSFNDFGRRPHAQRSSSALAPFAVTRHAPVAWAVAVAPASRFLGSLSHRCPNKCGLYAPFGRRTSKPLRGLAARSHRRYVARRS